MTQQTGSTTTIAEMLVPPSARLSRNNLMMAWWGVCSAMFYLVVAASLALNFGAINAIIGMAMSVVVYGLINAVIARYAIKTGLSVALFSQILLGRTGSVIATLIFFATAMYYAIFEGSVIAVGITTVFPSVSYPLAALIVVLLSVPLMFGNAMRWLDRLNAILLPVYIIGLVAAIVLAISLYGYNDQWLALGPAEPSPYGWWHTFVYYMGIWVLMMYTFDYARYGKKEDSRFHARVNFGMPFYFVAFFLSGLAGIFLVASVPLDGGLSEVSVLLALLKMMGVLGLLFVWATQTRINTANFYLAATNMQACMTQLIGVRGHYLLWALVVAGLVYVLMLADVFSYLLQALAYQGIFVVAWVAMALTHIALTHKQTSATYIQQQLEHVTFLRVGAVMAWLLAALTGITIMHVGGAYSSFSAPVTIVIASVVYAAFARAPATVPTVAAE
ncbi:allantoin permease [Alcaligenaceae bacterium 429]|nr:allantoin permease [Alcaligenaceae bacterium 429]